MRMPVQMLGQSGCRLEMDGQVIYIDPYLSNSVQELHSRDLVRQVPIPYPPEQVEDADWILITHEHTDHCDPQTLPALAAASPRAVFFGPAPVCQLLTSWGIAPNRVRSPGEDWVELTPNLSLRAMPAAHPEIERGSDGNWRYLGYLVKLTNEVLYFAGETRVTDDLLTALHSAKPIHTAFLPVNEINFFRNRKEIIGNMSVREALGLAEELGIEQVVATHWDMFATNSVYPEEICLVHERMGCRSRLLLNPTVINVGRVKASIVIRTLNEGRHLDALLKGIAKQLTYELDYEIVLIDSGSNDDTVSIAQRHGCRVLHIHREEFSFGRSLNIGCRAAQGDILVFTSGHCVPVDEHWLSKLCQPLLENSVDYTYGRQLGGIDSHFSEHRVFRKYFPATSRIPQDGYYCNNANAALLKSVWERYRFDESLTGLEDMALAQKLVRDGGRVGYIAESSVYHYHSETWLQVRKRFEREAIALREIMPQLHVGQIDTLRYIASSVWRDWLCAMRDGTFVRNAASIARYRYYQYTGSYRGNHQHRRLSSAEKDEYFFPV